MLGIFTSDIVSHSFKINQSNNCISLLSLETLFNPRNAVKTKVKAGLDSNALFARRMY